MQNQEALFRRLQKSQGLLDVVIVTGTFCEVDDQFVLAVLIKSRGHYVYTGLPQYN
jgi:hypothetical protein